MGLKVDHADVDRWAATLSDAVSRAPKEAIPVVNRGALQIKKGAQRRVRGHAHLPGYPWTISYDMLTTFAGPAAEIGPDKARGGQAPLGAIIEFGSVNSPPIPHMAPAADEELPKFAKALEDLGAKLLEQM